MEYLKFWLLFIIVIFFYQYYCSKTGKIILEQSKISI